MGETYLMIIWNALYMRSMSIILLPSFIIILDDIKVENRPKFICTTTSANNNSIYFSENELRLPLKLDEIISYLSWNIPINMSQIIQS